MGFDKRKDIVTEIKNGVSYENIISEGKDDREKGFIYETLGIITLISKYLIQNYERISMTDISKYPNLSETKNLNELFDVPLSQGRNESDITLYIDGQPCPFSIKYQKKYGKSALVDCSSYIQDDYKLGYIVRNKLKIINHKHATPIRAEKLVIDKVIENKLLFDEKDVIGAFKLFQNKLLSLKIDSVDDIIEWMNGEYLHNHRENLKLKFHQYLAFKLIMGNIRNGSKTHLLSHKPRSGKTITLLYICKYLLKSNNVILLMTSVMPDQILNSFISELGKYIEFKDIKSKRQDEFMNINSDFKGIVFCSVQYLKADTREKMNQLKKLNPGVTIFDECHFHSSNENTYHKIINATENENLIKIFASGTSNKTLTFYNVPDKCNSKWDTGDENMMKKIMNGRDRDDCINLMENRHKDFKYVFRHKNIVDCDYSNCPLQILLQPALPLEIIDDINKREDNKGYNCSSLFALKQIKRTRKKEVRYVNKFQLDENNSGRRFFIKFLESIISNDPNNENTMMREIENVQSYYKMKSSSEDNPRLFLMFLPYGQNIGNIDKIEETLHKFIKGNNLWSDYHICYSSSKKNKEDLDYNKDYSKFIENNMKITKDNNKLGCILFLGNQGKVGITYNDCDVTISFDNGTNIDDVKQLYYRSMTERKGKNIGINVDFNIQRTLLYHHQAIKDYKKITKSGRTLSEILQILYKENLYIFNPQEMKMGDCKQTRIDYFDKLQDKIKTTITIDSITDNIQCEDSLRDLDIKNMDPNYIKNPNLDGIQKECNKGAPKKIEIDPMVIDPVEIDPVEIDPVEIDPVEIDPVIDYNKTKHLYKKLSDHIGLILPIHKINPNNKDKNVIDLLKLLKDDENEMISIYELVRRECNIRHATESDLKIMYDKYIEDMDNENNIDILDTLFDFFKCSPIEVIRKRIAETLLPTREQIKNNAEIPTSEDCVDEMLNKIPDSFWTPEKRVFELCCGKGNFVLGIFEKFFNNLTDINDKKERCRIIIEKCIYFADIEKINIIHTKRVLVLLCAKMVLGEDAWHYDNYDEVREIYDFNFNEYIGNTLDLDLDFEFDAIIGNPPYQERNKNGKAKHGKSNLWTKFIDYSMNLLKKNGYLLFITPTSWMGGTVTCWDKMITNQIHYLNVNDCKKYFPGIGSTFSYYLIEKCDIYKDTEVVCLYNKKLYKSSLRLSNNLRMIPQLLNQTSLNIINKLFQWENEKIFVRKDMIKNDNQIQKENEGDHINPVITFVRPDGYKDIRYSNFKIFNQDDKKVLLFRSGYINPTYENGEAGVGNNIHYAVVETEQEGYNLENMYKSDLYKFMFSICATSQYNNGRIMNWLYRQNPQYEDIYDYFKLSETERELILSSI